MPKAVKKVSGIGLCGLAVVAVCAAAVPPVRALALTDRARQYLTDLIRIDTTNPPGAETRAAEYLKRVADEYEIPAELLGSDPARLNFVARLRGTGAEAPLLLMAHTDVVPADPGEWTADPFGAEVRDGFLYGRGAQDDKSLLAAELAVLVELKLRGAALNRDIILLAEADEESASSGIQWLVRNAWDKIEAGAALNEGGGAQDFASGVRLFRIQTAEKIPTRVTLRAHGSAGHASLPRPDNPILRLARAIVRLDVDQPVRMNTTTRSYFSGLARIPDYEWLAPLVPKLDSVTAQYDAAGQIRAHDAELDALLRTTIVPTMLRGGVKVNVIPNTAEAQVDIRRLPNETREEILSRLRRLINDSSVEIVPSAGSEMPATEPSSIAAPVYKVIERALALSLPRAVVVPFMSRGATDGAYLRQKGMDVYGVPLFATGPGESREHGNDERIALSTFESGTELLWKIVLAAGGQPLAYGHATEP